MRRPLTVAILLLTTATSALVSASTPFDFGLHHAATVSSHDRVTPIAWYDIENLRTRFNRSGDLTVRVTYYVPAEVAVVSPRTIEAPLDATTNWVTVGDLQVDAKTTLVAITAKSEVVQGSDSFVVGSDQLYLEQTEEGFSVLTREQYSSMKQASVARSSAPSTAWLEPGDVPGEALRPNGEPVDVCGVTVDCVR